MVAHYVEGYADVVGGWNGSALKAQARYDVPRIVEEGPTGGPQASLEVGVPRGGNASYFLIPGDVMQTSTGSMVFWIKSMDPAVTGVILNGRGAAFRLTLDPGGRLSLLFSGTAIRGKSAFQDGNWHQIAITWDVESHMVSLYADGSLVESASFPNDFPKSDRLHFGNVAVSTPDQQFSGCFNNLQFYRGVLSESQVQALFTNPETVPTK